MSPEAENIFEMPPHLFLGELPILGQTQNGRQADFFFFFSFCCNFYFLPLEQASLGVIIWGDKANPIGSGSPLHSAGGTGSPCLAARP